MAKENVAPLFKLPADVQAKLRAQENEMVKARKALVTLKELGMDVTELEERLTWAEKTRATLLKEFT